MYKHRVQLWKTSFQVGNHLHGDDMSEKINRGMIGTVPVHFDMAFQCNGSYVLGTACGKCYKCLELDPCRPGKPNKGDIVRVKPDRLLSLGGEVFNCTNLFTVERVDGEFLHLLNENDNFQCTGNASCFQIVSTPTDEIAHQKKSFELLGINPDGSWEPDIDLS